MFRYFTHQSLICTQKSAKGMLIEKRFVITNFWLAIADEKIIDIKTPLRNGESK